MSTGEFLGETIDVVEVAVGLVLVFLLQFTLVESIVVEWSGGGSARTGTGNRRGRSGQWGLAFAIAKGGLDCSESISYIYSIYPLTKYARLSVFLYRSGLRLAPLPPVLCSALLV